MPPQSPSKRSARLAHPPARKRITRTIKESLDAEAAAKQTLTNAQCDVEDATEPTGEQLESLHSAEKAAADATHTVGTAIALALVMGHTQDSIKKDTGLIKRKQNGYLRNANKKRKTDPTVATLKNAQYPDRLHKGYTPSWELHARENEMWMDEEVHQAISNAIAKSLRDRLAIFLNSGNHIRPADIPTVAQELDCTLEDAILTAFGTVVERPTRSEILSTLPRTSGQVGIDHSNSRPPLCP